MAGLFLDGSKLLYHLDKVSLWNNNQLVFPVHVEISPTSSCNQKCNLCYVDYLEHKSRSLSEKVLKTLMNDFDRVGVKSVLFAGEGEPLLNPHLEEVITDASLKNVDMAVNSNAVYLTRSFVDNALPALSWARFTVQASTEAGYNLIHNGKSDDFYRAQENLRYAVYVKKKRNLKVTLGMQQILINENFDDLYNTALLAKEIGLDYYVVKRFSKHGLNKYDVPEDLYKSSISQLNEIEKLSDGKFTAIVRWNNFTKDCDRIYNKCIGLPFIVQVLSDGSVYPCSQFFYKKDFCYGNLNESSFEEIMKSRKTKEVRNMIQNSVDVSTCMSYCRHHSTNQFLWQLYEKPEHISFI